MPTCSPRNSPSDRVELARGSWSVSPNSVFLWQAFKSPSRNIRWESLPSLPIPEKVVVGHPRQQAMLIGLSFWVRQKKTDRQNKIGLSVPTEAQSQQWSLQVLCHCFLTGPFCHWLGLGFCSAIVRWIILESSCKKHMIHVAKTFSTKDRSVATAREWGCPSRLLAKCEEFDFEGWRREANTFEAEANVDMFI